MNLRSCSDGNPALDPPPRPSPKGAEVYFRGGEVLIAATYWDTHGFGSGGDPIVLLPIDATAETIGGQIIRSVQSSRGGLSEKELEVATSAMFRAAGVSSWGEMEKNWEYIQIYESVCGNTITVSPLHRLDSGGYGGLEVGDDPVHHCRPDPEEIGLVVQKVVKEQRGREKGTF